MVIIKKKKILPKCIQVTRGGGEPLTLQSKRAERPSMTSRMSSLRVKRGSTEGVTLRLALDVNSSVEYNTHSFTHQRSPRSHQQTLEKEHLLLLLAVILILFFLNL